MTATLAVSEPQPGFGLTPILGDGTAIQGRRLIPLLPFQGAAPLAHQQPVAVGGQQAAPFVLVGHLGVCQHPFKLGDGQRSLIVAGVGLPEGPHEFGIPRVGSQGTLQAGDGGTTSRRACERRLACAIGGRGPLLLLGREQLFRLGGIPFAKEHHVLLQGSDAPGTDGQGFDVREPDLGGLVPLIGVSRHLAQQVLRPLTPTLRQIEASQPAPHSGLTRILPVECLQGRQPLCLHGRDPCLQQGIIHRHVEIGGQITGEQGAIETLGLLQPAGAGQQPGLLQLLAPGRFVQGQVGHALTIERRAGVLLAKAGQQCPGLLDLALAQGLTGLGCQQLRMIGLHQGERIEAVADEIFPPTGLANPDLLQQPGHRLYRPLRQGSAHQAGEQAPQGHSA